MLGNFTAVKILNSEVVDDLKKKSKTDECVINAVRLLAHEVLHVAVNPENEQRLDEQISRYEKNNINKKFPIHFLSRE